MVTSLPFICGRVKRVVVLSQSVTPLVRSLKHIAETVGYIFYIDLYIIHTHTHTHARTHAHTQARRHTKDRQRQEDRKSPFEVLNHSVPFFLLFLVMLFFLLRLRRLYSRLELTFLHQTHSYASFGSTFFLFFLFSRDQTKSPAWLASRVEPCELSDPAGAVCSVLPLVTCFINVLSA